MGQIDIPMSDRKIAELLKNKETESGTAISEIFQNVEGGGVVGRQGDKGDKGDKGDDSTVPGPKGDKGDKGDDSTVPGPKGDKGDKGDEGPMPSQEVISASVKEAVGSYGWVIAGFLDNGAHGEKLNIYYSPDGKTIFGGQQNPVYGADRLRDPSIIYYNNAFYVAYTLSDGIGRNFRIITSETGVAGSWTIAATVSVEGLLPAGDKCWAPELVVEGDDVYVFFTWQKSRTSETASGAGNGVLASMGWVKATTPTNGLKTWSAPSALETPGFPTAFIDGVPIEYESSWYLFASGGSQIFRGKGPSITGPFTLDKSGDWAGWGTGIEGPYVTKIGDTYRIYYDRYVANAGHWYSESTDLTTWTTPKQVLSAPYTLPGGSKIRHGSFLQLPDMEAASKAMSATMAPSGPVSAGISQSRAIVNAAQVPFNNTKIESDPRGMLTVDGAGLVYLAQGGTYMLTMMAAIETATSSASRFFIHYDNGGNYSYARFPMGGVGEDLYTASAIISVPMNTPIRVSAYHTQGSSKNVTVTTNFTRLGA